MKALRKGCAGFFLVIGLAILVLGTIDLVNPNTPDKDQEGALAAIVIFGVPAILIGAWIVWGLHQQHQHNLKQLSLKTEQIFLRLLQEQSGSITVMAFALAAQLPLAEAKQYLDHKARQLNADFEPSNEGGIVYRFPR